MKQLSVYLNFDGNTREALNHYAQALGGKVASIQTFGEAPPMPGAPPLDDAAKQRVMHGTVEADGIIIMASDTMPHSPVPYIQGTNVTLSMNLDSENEQTQVFNNLAEGGQVGMPLQDTFWGARFGMCTDKFGIHWMFNCEKK